ncbi:MAG: bifunctional 2-polyprenyl-6-hydroxyphenol methylase/3-demethylubiquinol 3-O-methyltransferase UbiG [Pseudomonadota bacterium]
MQAQPRTVDPDEIAKFEAMATEWWNPTGKFRALHALNPVRLDYICDQISVQFARDPKIRDRFAGLRVLDVGCGGGLVSEPMARLGAGVTGIDASGSSLPIARIHAEQSGVKVDYRQTTVEELMGNVPAFDIVLALEIIEHVADPAAFIQACERLLRPGGLFVVSTLNRSAKAFALAVVGAEYVLGWLPRGTHDWKKFLTPDELDRLVTGSGLEPVDQKGMVYNPLADRWRMSDGDLSINYIASAIKAA